MMQTCVRFGTIMQPRSPDKILCIDDEETVLAALSRTLGRQYTLYTANSAENALTILQTQPDIAVILCDYKMPGMNGIECLKQAKLLSPNSITIMLTADLSRDTVIKAINEVHVFRYIPKPCPTDVLYEIMIDALAQYHLQVNNQRLAHELEQTYYTLAKQHEQLAYELDMAKIIYSKVQKDQQNPCYGLAFLIADQETIGGDFIRTHISDDGLSFYFMLGDLTGHGLQSALAVILVTEVFDDSTCKNSHIETLAAAINNKIFSLLPTGLFCAGLLAKLDFANHQLQIWQGGLPAAYLLDTQGKIIKSLVSANLPLGVRGNLDFSGSSSCYALSEAQSLFVISDGVIEQQGGDDSEFGVERLQQAIVSCPVNQARVDFVMAAVRLHQQDQPQTDDICLAELNFNLLAATLKTRK